MSYVLITGASGGIGAEFAQIYAKRGENLILVARSLDKLTELKSELMKSAKVDIKVFSFDLSVLESTNKLMDEISDLEIKTLINNAGIGRLEDFCDDDLAGNIKMMNLNMTSLVALTHHVLQKMKDQKRGEILNVSSIAGFQPGPYMSVYYASKAFVTSFSEAISEELKDKNITVSCLCPGPVSTNFFDGAGLKEAGKLDKIPWIETPKTVAQNGVNLLDKKKVIGISGIINWLMSFSIRFTPRSVARKVVAKVNR